MYDRRTIRRRRAVLVLLVLASIVLLTASFGSGAGPITSVQRGVFEVLSPIRDGASRALTPIRDLFGWVGDTWNAKGENEDLREERDALRQEVASLRGAQSENQTLRGLLDLDSRIGVKDMGPVVARVTGASPSVLDQRLIINKGSSDGLRRDQPVITSGGLVGKVGFVAGGSAVVTLLTDASFAASAKIDETGVNGVVEPAAGSPRDLVMKFVPGSKVVRRGQTVVTRGTDSTSSRLPGLFPPDIPIGRVTRIDDPQTDAQRIRVRPFVDPRSVTYVQVLTETEGRS